MILFPYRAQIKLHKAPIVTITVAVVCLLVYFMQHRNEQAVVAHAERVCAGLAAASGEEGAAAQGYRQGRRSVTCEDAVLHIYGHPDPESHLAWHVEDMIGGGDPAAAERLQTQYRAFVEQAPALLTARLWHDRSRFDPIGMLTSSFAHGSWDHVIFNLIFFFAFAAAVELILGPVLFLGVIVALSFGIGLFDRMVSYWQDDLIPSLGLSGVVMGMLALFVYFLPRAKIRFFLWFMLSVGAFGVPAWLVGTWYIGWDLYYQLARAGGYVNFVAHLAGAGFGFLIGVLLFSEKRRWAKDIVEERLDLTQDESWIAKFNAVMVGPAVVGFAFVAGLLLIATVINLARHFSVVILLAAPALAAGYEIYRSRRADRPRRGRYRLGVEALARREYERAIEYLAPLAEKNDTRALYALGDLYAGATGALRDEAKATALYARAAERGHALAQYALGMRYADGRGVERDPARAAECYEQAALAGVPDAANSLGYVYENGAGIPVDREKAIEWYYRAGVGYHQARRLDDARAVIRHLDGLALKYPAVLALLVKLNALIGTQKP